MRFMEKIINLLEFLVEYFYLITFVEFLVEYLYLMTFVGTIINLPDNTKLFLFIGLFLLFSLLILCYSDDPEVDLLLLFLLFLLLYFLFKGGDSDSGAAAIIYYIIMYLVNVTYVLIINSLPIFI